MNQIKFNLDDLLKQEIPQVFKNKNAAYNFNLKNNDTEEKNLEGIQNQKKLIKQYLIDNNIPQQEKIEVHLAGETLLDRQLTSTLYLEGFYIEGYKIKYNYSKALCYFDFIPNYIHIGKRYISYNLNKIYMLLKDKFDIMPVYGDIVEYDYIKVKDNLGREYNKKILESKRTYKTLEYLEITKDKQLIDIDLSLIDEIENNIESFILKYV